MPAISVYHVNVSTVFVANGVTYYPGIDYWVDPATYGGKTADGRNFADLCLSAQQETVPGGGA